MAIVIILKIKISIASKKKKNHTPGKIVRQSRKLSLLFPIKERRRGSKKIIRNKANLLSVDGTGVSLQGQVLGTSDGDSGGLESVWLGIVSGDGLSLCWGDVESSALGPWVSIESEDSSTGNLVGSDEVGVDV